jgi:hypothetical protein
MLGDNSSPLVSAAHRARLETIVADASHAQKDLALTRIIPIFDRTTGDRRSRQVRQGRPASGVALTAALC